MAPVPFHYLDLRAFVYETEDDARVIEALRTLLPPEMELARDETEGHHGDRIVILSVRLERADEMRHVLDQITTSADLSDVVEELERRVDEDCSFFVRLDKQAAFRGEVTLGEGIQLRGKVEAYPAKRESAVENLHEYFAT